MRISAWSSDVCSSDLPLPVERRGDSHRRRRHRLRAAKLEKSHIHRYMARLMTAAMPIPGLIDPVPVPRALPAGDDARVDLVGLSREAIRVAIEEAGLAARQAKLRAKQIGRASWRERVWQAL